VSFSAFRHNRQRAIGEFASVYTGIEILYLDWGIILYVGYHIRYGGSAFAKVMI